MLLKLHGGTAHSDGGNDFLIHEPFQILHIPVKGFYIDKFIISDLAGGIPVPALFIEKHIVAGMIKGEEQFTVFADELAEAVHHDDGAGSIRIQGVVIPQKTAVKAGDASPVKAGCAPWLDFGMNTVEIFHLMYDRRISDLFHLFILFLNTVWTVTGMLISRYYVVQAGPRVIS